MSENHHEEHTSFIKTPKQLVIVVVLAFAVPVTLIVMLTHLVTGRMDTSPQNPALSSEEVAKRLQPVGTVVVADPSASRVERTGKAVVDAVCAACHATGALNAPKLGDKAAWAKLIAGGQEKLTASAMKGVRQMPARGGAPDLSDAEFARAVAYMANLAGANWKEPESKPAAVAAPAAAPAAAGPTMAQAPAPAPTAKADSSKGKAVFDSACAACHATGVAGAPKAGDRAAWAPRLKGGMEALYASAIKGKNTMPPKGGNLSQSDADVKAAVDYLVGLVK